MIACEWVGATVGLIMFLSTLGAFVFVIWLASRP